MTSGRLTPAAATVTSTSPAPGTGTGRSSGTSTSGPPGARIAIAVMRGGRLFIGASDGMDTGPLLANRARG